MSGKLYERFQKNGNWYKKASGTGTLAIRLIHIQKVVTNGQDLQLQIYIVFGLP